MNRREDQNFYNTRYCSYNNKNNMVFNPTNIYKLHKLFGFVSATQWCKNVVLIVHFRSSMHPNNILSWLQFSTKKTLISLFYPYTNSINMARLFLHCWIYGGCALVKQELHTIILSVINCAPYLHTHSV